MTGSGNKIPGGLWRPLANEHRPGTTHFAQPHLGLTNHQFQVLGRKEIAQFHSLVEIRYDHKQNPLLHHFFNYLTSRQNGRLFIKFLPTVAITEVKEQMPPPAKGGGE